MPFPTSVTPLFFSSYSSRKPFGGQGLIRKCGAAERALDEDAGDQGLTLAPTLDDPGPSLFSGLTFLISIVRYSAWLTSRLCSGSGFPDLMLRSH